MNRFTRAVRLFLAVFARALSLHQARRDFGVVVFGQQAYKSTKALDALTESELAIAIASVQAALKDLEAEALKRAAGPTES
jgi:hypothetical protein